MKAKIILSCVIILIMSNSCSSIKSKIANNNKSTMSLLDKLYLENNNSFYIKSSYTTVSKVWSYHNDTITIFKLKEGKVYEEQNFSSKQLSDKIIVNKNDLFELDKCIELDGDIFGIRIKQSDQEILENLPMSIECFVKNQYKSDFFNSIVNDIKIYKILE
ncbi:hypothetical protein SY27_11070 [Flavobacterium sp. 316]|uniref:hypothetical protein n=1 Tax=Flavobacterium sp. 316 TaxID=1603293 RepID=UPI0005DB5E06|nr:hypothetical protein [Flavobacterium sp. 316]KIX21279.1 hypothetical protein SY27_11070 [Flavobacterium sp. 316]